MPSVRYDCRKLESFEKAEPLPNAQQLLSHGLCPCVRHSADAGLAMLAIVDGSPLLKATILGMS